MTLPLLLCPALPNFSPDWPWPRLLEAFAPCPAVPFVQGWRDAPEDGFRAASVRAGWTPETLWLLADLEDDDIHNAAMRPNQSTHELGDVFELFVRPNDGPRYFELHVTPENQTLQLEFPRAQSGNDWPAPGSRHDVWRVTRALVEDGRWQVLVGVRFAALYTQTPVIGTTWRFSCSRYDVTRGTPTPILSSTSPHRIVNFHDQSAWGTLVFGE